MRVIAGTARSIPLLSRDGIETRPTADRVKEAIFNVVQFEIEGRQVLDLFGGSGQLAIEALSRGAAGAVIVDQSKDSVSIIKQNPPIGAECGGCGVELTQKRQDV